MEGTGRGWTFRLIVSGCLLITVWFHVDHLGKHKECGKCVCVCVCVSLVQSFIWVTRSGRKAWLEFWRIPPDLERKRTVHFPVQLLWGARVWRMDLRNRLLGCKVQGSHDRSLCRVNTAIFLKRTLRVEQETGQVNNPVGKAWVNNNSKVKNE